MSATKDETLVGGAIPEQAVPPAMESVLPELRAADWRSESGYQASGHQPALAGDTNAGG